MASIDCKLTVKVSPRASRNEVVQLEDGTFKVKLCAPPVDGSANDSLRQVLAKHFGVKRSQIWIVRGENSRTKTVEIKSVN